MDDRGRAGAELLILAGSAPGKSKENWYASQNDEAAQRRIPQIIGKRVVKKQGGRQHKQRRHDGISPDPIRPGGLRIASPEYKHRAPGDHIKQPFGENRQRKKLPEASPEKQQDDGKGRLHREGN